MNRLSNKSQLNGWATLAIGSLIALALLVALSLWVVLMDYISPVIRGLL